MNLFCHEKSGSERTVMKCKWFQQIWIRMPDFGKLQKLPGFCKVSIGQETDVCFNFHWAAKEKIVSIDACCINYRNIKAITISNYFSQGLKWLN